MADRRTEATMQSRVRTSGPPQIFAHSGRSESNSPEATLPMIVPIP